MFLNTENKKNNYMHPVTLKIKDPVLRKEYF